MKKEWLYIGAMLANFALSPLLARIGVPAMIVMLVIIPMLCLIISEIHGFYQKKVVLFALITGVLFLPFIFVFYNTSAWIYSPFYGVLAFISGWIGKRISR